MTMYIINPEAAFVGMLFGAVLGHYTVRAIDRVASMIYWELQNRPRRRDEP